MTLLIIVFETIIITILAIYIFLGVKTGKLCRQHRLIGFYYVCALLISLTYLGTFALGPYFRKGTRLMELSELTAVLLSLGGLWFYWLWLISITKRNEIR